MQMVCCHTTVLTLVYLVIYYAVIQQNQLSPIYICASDFPDLMYNLAFFLVEMKWCKINILDLDLCIVCCLNCGYIT